MTIHVLVITHAGLGVAARLEAGLNLCCDWSFCLAPAIRSRAWATLQTLFRIGPRSRKTQAEIAPTRPCAPAASGSRCPPWQSYKKPRQATWLFFLPLSLSSVSLSLLDASTSFCFEAPICSSSILYFQSWTDLSSWNTTPRSMKRRRLPLPRWTLTWKSTASPWMLCPKAAGSACGPSLLAVPVCSRTAT